jgi:hypothetical protein
LNLLKVAVVAVLAMAALVWLLVAVPVEVPDTSSPPDANHEGTVNGANSLGQTFVPSRDGLDRVDVGLAVQQPTDRAELTFQVMEVPWKKSRTVTRRMSALPVGLVTDYRPGTITERWYSFSFEPVADSAGKEMFFSLEGREIQGPNSVGLLMFFHNSYPLGEAFLNGEALNANVVFRTYTKGNVLDLTQVVVENWSTHKSVPFDHPAVICGIALLFAGMAGTTLGLLLRPS